MEDERTILIKGGSVAQGDVVSRQDVLIRGETIARLGDLSGGKADKTIDADGLLVLPGGVDTHVHFNDEFMGTVSVHDYYTGTLAAAYGGTTSIIDFSNQAPNGTLMQTLQTKREEAKGLALIDWGVHPVITRPTQETMDEIPLVVQEGAPTIKCYMTYREEGIMTEAKDLKRILTRLREHGGMLMVHAEDNDMIEKNVPDLIAQGLTKAIYHARSKPPECEDLAIRQAIEIARETGGRLFIVHLASDEGLRMVSDARTGGVDVLAETCTHYLIFSEKMLERDDGIKWICSPPLRDKSIQDALWAGVKGGQICQVSSDDAAFSWEAKLLGKDRFDKCPNGIPGIETRIPVLYSEGVAKGRISLPRFVDLVSTTPARLFGLAPRKGSLAPGSDADIVLLDPNMKWILNRDTSRMATDWSPFDEMEITGKIIKVFSRGELIIDGGACLAEKGRGRYLHRKLN
jgi:dihydropyrimidinase